MTSRSTWNLPAVAWLLIAAGCGGVGGDDNKPSTGPYAVQEGLRRLLDIGGQWNNLAGNAGGQAFTMTIGLAPAGAAAFPVDGTLAARSIETLGVASGGQTNTSTQTIYFS